MLRYDSGKFPSGVFYLGITQGGCKNMSDVKIPEDVYKLLETVFTESSAIYFEKADRDKLREFFARKKAARNEREESRKKYKAKFLK